LAALTRRTVGEGGQLLCGRGCSQGVELGEELEGVGVQPVLDERAVLDAQRVGAGEADGGAGMGLGSGKPPA
jgi:hypothetical protein